MSLFTTNNSHIGYTLMYCYTPDSLHLTTAEFVRLLLTSVSNDCLQFHTAGQPYGLLSYNKVINSLFSLTLANLTGKRQTMSQLCSCAVSFKPHNQQSSRPGKHSLNQFNGRRWGSGRRNSLWILCFNIMSGQHLLGKHLLFITFSLCPPREVGLFNTS